MKIFFYGCWIGCWVLFFSARAGAQETGPLKSLSVKSPGNRLVVNISTDQGAALCYSVQLDGHPVITSSRLGITVNHTDLGKGSRITFVHYSSASEKYPWKGVHDTAVNRYRDALLKIRPEKSRRTYFLEVRVFDDGMAFRYIVPATGLNLVGGEASSWKIPAHSTIWYQENTDYYEGLYYSGEVSNLVGKKAGPPVTYRTPAGIYGCITEAALVHYSGLSLRYGAGGALQANFAHDPRGWQIKDSIITPWRVVLASEDLNGLVNSDIIPDLNPPADPSFQGADWIKPGRAVWSYFEHDNVTTAALEKEYVDKAAAIGFEYSMVDAGWEEWSDKWATLKDLVNYAKAKKVGIWVWKAYSDLKENAARKQFFKTLHEAGVAGIKIDFIDKEGIRQVDFYQDALKDAAAERLMIDFHGAAKPTGTARTYPNELSREAIYGQEWRTYTPQGAINNATIPFTRFLAGPADYTPGVFNSSKAYGTSRAQQVALPILYTSPFTCWPEDPDVYLASPAASVIRSIPTIWDETIVLPPSRIGELAAFARRSGNDWYIAVSNGGAEKNCTLPLFFLGAGYYEATLLKDDLKDADRLFRSQTSLRAGDSLFVPMRSKGGFVARLVKMVKPSLSLVVLPENSYLADPIQVSMLCSDKDLQIRYTKDGSEPDQHSDLYKEPFLVNSAVLIRSRVFDQEKPLEASRVSQYLLSQPPVIKPDAGLFIQTQKIELSCQRREDSIHYTLDGSAPILSSPIYRGPFTLDHGTTLQARSFSAAGFGSETATRVFTRVLPSSSSHPASVTPGLAYQYYEGDWTLMPDFRRLKAKRSAVVTVPVLDSLQTSADHFGLAFEGFAEVATTGVYSFYILSDDGSQLFIDDKMVADNDGCHGDLEKSGEVALEKGKHVIRLLYFQSGSGKSLQLFFKAPGSEKMEIPAKMFSHL